VPLYRSGLDLTKSRVKIESSKDDLRRRLNIAKNSDQHNIVYSDENNHNPVVFEKCPACFGSGKKRTQAVGKDEITISCDACPECAGTKTSGKLVRRYQNDSPAIEAVIDELGWTKCPGCGVNFSTSNSASRSGLRHKTCGQKIQLQAQQP
ncbi:MAG TPA: hypothetical protein VEZ90_18500, partial [Blastocatellia bacterium]|nr:hypothetical protein [Blastocatellia bacterium]